MEENLYYVKMWNDFLDNEEEQNENESGEETSPYRRLLSLGIMKMTKKRGASHIEWQCLETLTEMLQSLICAIGLLTCKFTEHNNRIMPCINDVQIALIDMGLPINWIDSFMARKLAPCSSPFKKTKVPLYISTLYEIRRWKNGCQSKFYTPFPSLHTYVRTPIYRMPLIDYVEVREKKAEHKINMLTAVNRYMSNTANAKFYFSYKDGAFFPMVPAEPTFPAYMDALYPTDQIFDYDELEYHYKIENCNNNSLIRHGKMYGGNMNVANQYTNLSNSVLKRAILQNPNINNPYLNAPTLPKRAKTQQRQEKTHSAWLAYQHFTLKCKGFTS